MSTFETGTAPLRWGGFRPNAIWQPNGALVYVRELLGEGGVTQIIFEDNEEKWTNISLCLFDPWLE